MKKRRNTILTRIMIMALIVTNSAGSMPVFAAPENGFEEDFGFKDKFEEEYEAEAENDGVAEDETDIEEETFVEELEDIELITITCGECGVNSSADEKITWELGNDGTLVIHASGRDQEMRDYEADTAPWRDLKDEISSIVFSGDIVNVGDYAFYGCSNLTEVELASSIEKIGKSAFEDCRSLKLVSFDDPDSISIEFYDESAFRNCQSLIKMPFSQRTIRVEDYAFDGCVSYTDKGIEEFPITLTNIGAAAFRNCQAIESLKIPYSVNCIFGGYIGEDPDMAANSEELDDKLGAFAGCTGLKTVQFYTLKNGQGIERIDDFSFSDTPIGMTFNYHTLNRFVKGWYKKKNELKNGIITRDEYFEWKINWPYSDD